MLLVSSAHSFLPRIASPVPPLTMAALLLRLVALAIVTLHAGTAASAGPVNVGETRRSCQVPRELVRTVASPPQPAVMAPVC